ncbi:transposase [Nostocaceae cyanobacterium CENA357]|uniref:Transposase n=1 Tax=Atlanticothrix silvestris CENA357 TaxID=1725252 RepID=A0A8J7KYQ9_9CYAN|nr:transposase [Atlanticothrix silvestris]MBH8551216.1 transposase [Atlanticothrix silvestris CENA357]
MSPSYPSNLTSEQWELLSSLIPQPKTGGRKQSVDMQAIVNAIMYILCAGCAWQMLPNDFPKWKTVYHYFRQWRIDKRQGAGGKVQTLMPLHSSRGTRPRDWLPLVGGFSPLLPAPLLPCFFHFYQLPITRFTTYQSILILT